MRSCELESAVFNSLHPHTWKDFGGNPDRDGPFIINDYNDDRIAKYNGCEEVWWLRSPGDNSHCAACVTPNGSVDVGGTMVFHDGGVRPALWLKDVFSLVFGW